VSGCRRLAAALVAALCLAPSGAQAQDRLFRGLFRASDDPAASRDRLDLVASADYGYDRVRYDSTFAGPLERPVSVSGRTPGASASLIYWHRGNRVGFALAGGGYYRSYSTLPDQTFPSAYQLSRVTAKVTPRTELRLSQGLNYSGYYGYSRSTAVEPEPEEGPFDGVPDTGALVEPEDAFFAERRSNYVYTGGFEVLHRFSERSTLSTTVSGRYVDFRDESPDMTSGRAGIRFNRRMTPYATMRMGYAFSTWRYASFGTRLASHDIHAGVAYSRPLPASRRTRVGFDLSSAVVDAPGSAHFRVNGFAYVSHIISREWVAGALYRRDNEVVEGFAVPFFLFSDTIGGSLTGVIARRVALSVGGGYSFGRYTIGPLENRSEWINGSVTARSTIYRTLAGYVQGGTGQYDFDRRLGLYRSTPLSNSRYWVRAGVVFGLPLIT
jgi:hypothetical protein